MILRLNAAYLIVQTVIVGLYEMNHILNQVNMVRILLALTNNRDNAV